MNTALILIGILVGTTESASYCQTGNVTHNFYRGSCCDGESYFLGHGRVRYAEECFQEHKDDHLPYRENHWAFYECIVKKSLGRQELNEKNFVHMMAQNMSVSKRRAVEEFMTSDLGSVQPASALYRDQLKFLWKRYMDAEFAICGKNLAANCSTLQDPDWVKSCLKERRYVDYEPAYFCTPYKAALWANPYHGTNVDYNNCMDSTKRLLAPHYVSFDNKIQRQTLLRRAACICMTVAMAPTRFRAENIFKHDLDFGNFYHIWIPRFLSRSSKQLVAEQVDRILVSKNVLVDSASSHPPFGNFIQFFSDGADMASLDKTQRVQKNLNAMVFLSEVAQQAQQAVCAQQWMGRY